MMPPLRSVTLQRASPGAGHWKVFSLVGVRGVSWLLGGVFYPLEVLRPLLPITHALTGMRMAILEGAPLSLLAPQIGALALFAALGLPLSLWLFQAGMHWTRTSGSLGHF
ncbi:MAG: hypothetical protein A3F68_12345 [Acidobacteria bacterium RIFCSPLOWO2_12_FULL_54_10]|nr:MAG: hypothetical protein A3F68_12345 [Acidobacteria bacterium RIFCSPLOWO2_12_FULL_54_10]OFW14623.1 MAG: hypothetical protein A3H27_07045 [Acidobacteria bacterium RIFCSPLOWO2_02_FULL_59_13]